MPLLIFSSNSRLLLLLLPHTHHPGHDPLISAPTKPANLFTALHLIHLDPLASVIHALPCSSKTRANSFPLLSTPSSNVNRKPLGQNFPAANQRRERPAKQEKSFEIGAFRRHATQAPGLLNLVLHLSPSSGHQTAARWRMTDNPASPSTQTALPVPNGLSNQAPSLNGTPTSALPEEDEPYTIKCICNFQEDDGNTVLCENCDTWQHIECYYHGSRVPDIHNCVDCEPRSLDHKHATERQKLRRDTAIGDRKAKRPATKSHKKKPKELSASGTSANGWPSSEAANGVNGLDRRAGSPRDQGPPTKRPKTTHRNSSSTSSHSHQKSPSLAPIDSRRNGQSAHARTHSPSKTPVDHSHEFAFDAYAPEFLRLNQADPQEAQIQTQTNSFSTIAVVNSLSSWIQDPDICQRATNGRLPAEIFQRWTEPLESLARAELSQRTKELAADAVGTRPLCRYIVAESIVPLDGVIDELKGSIGYADDYRQDPSGRYRQLQHAEPFVFFHPHLPIFIDTRLEGTQLRYVRRSCRANTSLKTIVTNGTECHFCFCATQTIEPGSEVTVGWDLGDQIREFIAIGDAQYRGDSADGLNREQFESLSAWVSRLLASHGGCACPDPQTCLFFAFDRRALEGSPHSRLIPATASRSKKSKKGKALSPLYTGEGSSKHAESEGFKREEQDNDEDSRSTSESIRSKPHSRDLTPSNPHSTDARIHQAGMSDREKRKIAALEKTFEQMEEKDHHHKAYKKQKRSSGGSTNTTPGVTTSVSFAIHTSFTIFRVLIIFDRNNLAVLLINRSHQHELIDHSTSALVPLLAESPDRPQQTWMWPNPILENPQPSLPYAKPLRP